MASSDRQPAEARFERLFREHYAAVLSYARRRVALEAVDDVVEETFLVAWRRLDDVPDVPLPWLYGVARNVIGTQTRGAVRRRALSVRLTDAVAAAPLPPPVEPERFGRVLAAALRRLSTEDREALMLVAWEGLAPREAARALGEPAVTFRVRLHRARRRLRALLDEANEVNGSEPSEVAAT